MVSYQSLTQAMVLAALVVLLANLLIADPVIRVVVSLLALAPLAWLLIKRSERPRKRSRENERRLNGALRVATNHFLVSVRNLNRLKVIADNDEELAEAEALVDEVVGEMHQLVERMRGAAGRSPQSLRPKGA